MTKKLDVGKALEKLRGSDKPKTRMTLLDEKNEALDEEKHETDPNAVPCRAVHAVLALLLCESYQNFTSGTLVVSSATAKFCMG